MSVYEGTALEQSYTHGRDDGRAAAQWDRDHGALALDARAQEYRLEAAAPDGSWLGTRDAARCNAAYGLGWVRGYREEIR